MPRPFNGSVRTGQPSDTVALTRILHDAFSPYTAIIGRPPTPLSLDVPAAIEAGEILVADDGGPLGFSCAFARDGELYIDVIAVDPAAQGRGVGARLILALERAAQAAGHSALTLYTNALMHQALGVYHHLGFSEVDRRHEDGFDRVFMRRPVAPALNIKGSVGGLFGRRRGPGFRHDTAFDALAIDLSTPASQPLTSLFDAPVTKVRLEVGFGGGEHLIDHAAREPTIGLIGAEPYETGMMQAARAAAAQGLQNVRLHMGDARPLIDWLPAASVDRIDILYPDPWPKQRHWKRRFISIANLTAMRRVLAPGATVRFASDIPAYCDWTRSHVRAHAGFAIATDTPEAWPHWPSTRYEAKALREGRTPQYLTLRPVTNAADHPTL